MIAVVLMIAFTVAVGGIILPWLMGMMTSATTATGSSAEKQTFCGNSVLNVKEVYSSFGTNDTFNVTVSYDFGTQNLYNFNLTYVDNSGTSVTVQPKTGRNPNKTYSLSPGALYVFSLNLAASESDVAVAASLPGSSLRQVVVVGMCQDTYPVPGECKSGQVCMK